MKYFLLTGLVFVPVIASAQVVITEIMYDLDGSDAGREWVEVLNTGQSPVPLTTLRLFENATNHKISVVGGSDVVLPGSFAVIADNPAKFKADWPAYQGPLFDSAFSLSNDGEELRITNGEETTLDAASYSNAAANGTGDSLQRSRAGEVFNAGEATPGSGIPEGGLVARVKQTKKAAATSAAPEPAVLGEASAATPVETYPILTATSEESPLSVWLLGVGAMSIVSAVGVTWSRHLRRDEWEIEEIGETG